jgi:LacI family transcriptional regulator
VISLSSIEERVDEPESALAPTSRVTSRDIAAAAGVSQATVSNVLNRPELVAPETRKRVEEVILEQGFVVNSFGRALRMGTSRALGVVVLDLGNPFWAEVTRGIEAAASDLGYSVLLGSSNEREDKEQQLLGLFEEHRVEGVLVSSVHADSLAMRSLARRGTKVVLLDQGSADDRYSSVRENQVHGAQLVATHLLEHGHRRIAFVNGPHSIPWCAERAQGLREGVAAYGLDPDVVITEVPIEAMTALSAESAIEELLLIRDRPTAVFCVNDLVALGMLKQFSQRGIRVPQDFSIIGFDDSYFASQLSPSLTTIRQQPYALGKRATELMASLDSKSTASAVVFEPSLIDRDSVAKVPVADGTKAPH